VQFSTGTLCSFQPVFTLYAVIAVLVFWILFYFLFVKLFKLKEIIWIRLEYLWIAVGFIAVFTLIENNKKSYDEQKLSSLERWIDLDYSDLLFLANLSTNCMQFQYNPDLYTQDEFNLIQSRQDSICRWTKMLSIMADSCFKNKKSSIINIPKIEISIDGDRYPCDRIDELIRRINENVNKKDILFSGLKSGFWNDFKSGLGVMLLFIAFAIRLTIISHKVKNEKNKA
jgi:hypothetical protein